MAQPATGNTFVPEPLTKIEHTGLSQLWLQDLVLKIIYFGGYLNGFQVAEKIALPFSGIVEFLLEALKKEKFVEVKSQMGGLGEGAYQYAITSAGIQRAREALERSQYAGPAPVPIEYYYESIIAQSQMRASITQQKIRQALQGLVINQSTFHQIGPAANSGQSIFMYGPPGNGKTTIARAIGNMTGSDTMYIPFALDVDGQVVKLYDSVNHQLSGDEETTDAGTGTLKSTSRRDPRWVKIKRPFIVVGGELTMAGLDLVFDDTNKFYEAPFQLKANGGIFLIDDFGRQMVRRKSVV